MQISRARTDNALQTRGIGGALTGGDGSSPLSALGATTRRPNLSMYAVVPEFEITLEDFEVLAFDRLKVLKGIESLRTRNLTGGDMRMEIFKLLEANRLADLSNPEIRRRDEVSHQILRLAYASNLENQRWFVTMEVALFRARLEREPPAQVSQFMNQYEFSFDVASEEEIKANKEDLRDVLTANPMRPTDVAFEAMPSLAEMTNTALAEPFYKVPFTQALGLVKARQVYIKGGQAFIPTSRIRVIIADRFATYLKRTMAYAIRGFHQASSNDERLGPILTNLSRAWLGPAYGQGGRKAVDTITAADVDELAESSFPLCMQYLHENLKKDHHLKHSGRMQYGLFLKGVGLTLDDAIEFWKREFTKAMTPDDFMKKYAYNIRHNYGKEGKRTDYTPYHCASLNGPSAKLAAPGHGEFHGCPYKHWDGVNLRTYLTKKFNLSSPQLDSIMQSVERKDYGIACRKQFEARFPMSDAGNVGNHPNAYVEAAQAFLKAEAAKKAGGAAAPAAGGAAGAPAPASSTSPAAAPAAAAAPSNNMEDDDFAAAALAALEDE